MQFDNPRIFTKDEAVKIFERGDVNEICEALISVTLNNLDWKWCQELCIDFLDHENEDVSGLAATCLGHIARIHGQLDKQRVVRVLNQHRNRFSIVGRIEDALDDIEMFVK